MRYRPVYDEDDYEYGGFVSDEDRGGFREEEYEGGFVSEDENYFSEEAAAAVHEEKLAHRQSRKAKKQRRKLRRVLLLLALLLVIEGVFLYGRWARPPQVNRELTEQTAEETTFRHVAGRKDGCYTFLIAGKDKAAGLTDTVLVGMLDAQNHTLRFVSIPRDTAVNISWSPKKINQYYPAAENRGEDGVAALLTGVEKLIGYRVDSYAIFDVDVFVELVDTMGGVWFDVPIDMNYDDAGQDLYIHVNQGYQLLDGYNTMCVFRYRSTYANGVARQHSERQKARQSLRAQCHHEPLLRQHHVLPAGVSPDGGGEHRL